MPATTARNPFHGTVLISGASIAGPALAYWLHRFGFDVTVVERADAVRSGGYPIDVRGTAIDVVERMGLLSQLKAAHIDSRKLTFVDAAGATIGVIRPEALTGGVSGRDIELPRGALTSLLHELTRDTAIHYRFNDSIDVLEDDGAGINVRFKGGAQGRFDIVVGADGLHSKTRALAFGPEQQFNRYLGRCFNLFSLPNYAGLSHEGVTYAEPGRMAGVYAVGDSDTLHGFLTFAADEPPFLSHPDIDAQRRRTAKVFAGDGWEVPRLVEAMLRSDDLYFDTVSQIHMPRWSAGRVVLVGDAAYAPSFLSGQGSSLALVGAYVLAGELATHAVPTEAFASYERIIRPFIEANQALATRGGGLLLPRTPEELDARNRAFTAARSSGEAELRGETSRLVHSSLQLPDYAGGAVNP
ncbi:FAD-dependent monooxygenase [Bradyrhizobium sp. dw_78]|uniref:FAD-dependent monooxygenase n=1 Tax=Bradyrhizobium sp. dw_78 TaxID=2719793 RepID=UPI001BD51D96|nr:FAD-dependent monooxygenase [Bradyrhizobium sp. dw_78]